MSNPIVGHLPPPHAHIGVSVTAWRHNSFVVDYIARPAELLAAGLVTPHMEQKILYQRCGIHMDEAGRRFKLRSLTDQQPKRILWNCAVPIVLRYYRVSRHAFLDLPGVCELYPEGLPTQEEQDDAIRANPGPGDRVCGSMSIQACVYAESVGRVVSRARAVGRHQRLMRWYLVGDSVIAPDWSWMIGKRLKEAMQPT